MAYMYKNLHELLLMTSESDESTIRVWMDGCFDLVHYGHADACRQAKLLGHYLIVGIHSDAEITKNKGSPVSKEEERYELMRAIKWVDEVVENAPYVPTLATLNKYNCNFCVHGEELAVDVDGIDHHEPVRTAGRYKDLIRTLPISTTKLIERMLRTVTTNDTTAIETDQKSGQALALLKEKIEQFSNHRQPKPGDRIIFAPGVFDLFHTGHVDFLQKAKALGDYLIVGIYSDEDARLYRSKTHLVMNLYERALSVAACRFVDQVIIGPAYIITEDFITKFHIDLVIHGHSYHSPEAEESDRFEVSKRLDKFRIVDSGNTVTENDIIERVVKNRDEYEARNLKKMANEVEGYKQYMSKQKT